MNNCHVPQCQADLLPGWFLCRPHWAMIPWRLKGALWAFYKPGQECHRWKDVQWETQMIAGQTYIESIALEIIAIMESRSQGVKV